MEQAKQFTSPLRKILFCTDFSENADFAFDFAFADGVALVDGVFSLAERDLDFDAAFFEVHAERDDRESLFGDARAEFDYLALVH